MLMEAVNKEDEVGAVFWQALTQFMAAIKSDSVCDCDANKKQSVYLCVRWREQLRKCI
jgi:hypothetical protein